MRRNPDKSEEKRHTFGQLQKIDWTLSQGNDEKCEGGDSQMTTSNGPYGLVAVNQDRQHNRAHYRWTGKHSWAYAMYQTPPKLQLQHVS